MYLSTRNFTAVSVQLTLAMNTRLPAVDLSISSHFCVKITSFTFAQCTVRVRIKCYSNSSHLSETQPLIVSLLIRLNISIAKSMWRVADELL